MSAHVPCRNCGNLVLPDTSEMNAGLCIPCHLKRRHNSNRVSTNANPDAWSDESKKSRTYTAGETAAYFDEYYWCEECGTPCVFSGTDQKEAYEVQKRYIFQIRKLCSACWDKKRSAIA